MERKAALTITTLAAGLAMFASMTAQAVPPHTPDLTKGGNRWLITAYNDRSPTHDRWATQGLCFFKIADVGTHTLYGWYSDTFPDWNGLASQEGDQIVMHGDYAADVGHDGMEWELVTNSYTDEGAGHWKEWRENGKLGRTIGFANAKLSRVGYCRYIDLKSTNEAGRLQELEAYSLDYSQIPYPTAVTGEMIVSPSGDGLTNDINTVLEAR